MPTTTTRARRSSIFFNSSCTAASLVARSRRLHVGFRFSISMSSGLDATLQDCTWAVDEHERCVLFPQRLEKRLDPRPHVRDVFRTVRVAARGVVVAALEKLFGGAPRRP